MTNTPIAGALAIGLFVFDSADIPPVAAGCLALIVGYLIGRVLTHGKA